MSRWRSRKWLGRRGGGGGSCGRNASSPRSKPRFAMLIAISDRLANLDWPGRPRWGDGVRAPRGSIWWWWTRISRGWLWGRWRRVATEQVSWFHWRFRRKGWIPAGCGRGRRRAHSNANRVGGSDLLCAILYASVMVSRDEPGFRDVRPPSSAQVLCVCGVIGGDVEASGRRRGHTAGGIHIGRAIDATASSIEVHHVVWAAI